MMKPFDLQAAIRGEPIVTRNGECAIFIGYDEFANFDSRVIARIRFVRGVGRREYNEAGRYYKHKESAFDLFMAEKPQE